MLPFGNINENSMPLHKLACQELVLPFGVLFDMPFYFTGTFSKLHFANFSL
jgi:hypothetical protein